MNMSYEQLADELLRDRAKEADIQVHFAYKGKCKFADVEKHVRNTRKTMKQGGPAATKYLASLLTLTLRYRKTA